MAKRTSRGRKQDRARVVGGQGYELKDESKKTGQSKAAVKPRQHSKKPNGSTTSR